MADHSYTEEIGELICRRLASGEGLRAICRDDGMPGRQTVLDWLNDDRLVPFRAKYARAREAQADYLDEEMQSVADTATPENVQVARLRVGTMQWRASKLSPKKYGDKLALGGDGDAPPIAMKVEGLDQLEPAERAAVREMIKRRQAGE